MKRMSGRRYLPGEVRQFNTLLEMRTRRQTLMAHTWLICIDAIPVHMYIIGPMVSL